MMAWMDDDAAAQNCAGEEGLLVWCGRGGDRDFCNKHENRAAGH
jgi:hypothetical protein